MDTELSLNILAKDSIKGNIDFNKKILEISSSDNKLFEDNDENVQKLNMGLLREYSFNEIFTKNTKYDYIILNNVIEYNMNPLNLILQCKQILNNNGKLCLLIQNKNFTKDHFRENSSFADLFDVYISGEKNNLPRLILDSMVGSVENKNPVNYWNNTNVKISNPNVNSIEIYNKYRHDLNDYGFDESLWVFTEESFLNILYNLIFFDIIPFKISSFYPTSYNDDNFGVVFEVNKNYAKNKQLSEIQEFKEKIKIKKNEINDNYLYQENIRLIRAFNKMFTLFSKFEKPKFIDKGVRKEYNDNYFNGSNNLKIERFKDGTKLTNFSDRPGFFIPIDNDNGSEINWNNVLVWNLPFALEFNLIITNNNDNFIQIYDGTNEMKIKFGQLNVLKESEIKILSDGLSTICQVNDDDPIIIPSSVKSISRIGLVILPNSTLTYKNFRIY